MYSYHGSEIVRDIPKLLSEVESDLNDSPIVYLAQIVEKNIRNFDFANLCNVISIIYSKSSPRLDDCNFVNRIEKEKIANLIIGIKKSFPGSVVNTTDYYAIQFDSNDDFKKFFFICNNYSKESSSVIAQDIQDFLETTRVVRKKQIVYFDSYQFEYLLPSILGIKTI